MKTNLFILMGFKAVHARARRAIRPYGLECVNGVEEPASVSGYEGGTKGLSLTLYVVQGKNNYFSLC